MSSPGDYVPVRVGPAFGIAPCGELWAKEFGGEIIIAVVRWRYHHRQILYMWCSNVYKMASYTVVLLKKFAARPGGKGFSLQRGGARKT